VTLTITASGGTMVHGGTVPTINASYSGFVNGDTSASLITHPTCSTTATSASAVGSYPSSCSGAADPNYTIGYADGTVTVTAAGLVITASSGTMAYGGTVPTITPTYSGWAGSDSPSSLTTAPNCTTAVTNSSHVGSYATTCSGAVDPNYTISYVNGTLAVTPAPLTITASSATMVYGAAVPAITPSYKGWVNSDTEAILTTLPGCDTTATSTSQAGSYPSECYGAETAGHTDYAISYVNGTVTVTKVTLTVTADDKTRSVGAPDPTFTARYKGWVNGDTTAVLTGSPAFSTTATAASGVGTYPITPTVGTLAATSYTFIFVDGTLTVSDKPILTITASSDTMVYGGTVPTITATFKGWVGSDTESSLAALPICDTDATPASTVGSYTSRCHDADSAKYAISYVDGTVSVTKATLTVTADDKTRTLGAPDPTFTAGYTGWVNGDTSAVLTGSPAFSTTATVASPIGTYPITPTAGTLAATNYNFTFVDGTLTVTARPVLTVTANDQSREYLSNNPSLTYGISGYLSGDDDSIVKTKPTCTTTATSASLPGTYPITCTGAGSDKYDFNYVAGTLTVTGQVIEPATFAPVRSPTPPVTTIKGDSPIGDPTPIIVVLMCLAFAALGLLAVQAQRRSMRR
jgi:hypothetical protein